MKVISLGVGIQSTALYYQSSMGELERCDYAIFSDTGGEKTSTLNYYKLLQNWEFINNGIEMHYVHEKNLKSDLLNQTNSRNSRFASIPAFTKNNENKVGMLRRQCTGEYKIQPVNNEIKRILGLSKKQRFPVVEIWQGITLDEAHRMAIPPNKWQVNVYPFCGYKIRFGGDCERIDTKVQTRNDVINWFNLKGIPIPKKSSCVFCPFQSDANWLDLKRNYPEDFETAVKVDLAIRNSSMKGIKNPIYLHDSLRPLSEVDLSETQLTIWGNCTDSCDI